MIVFEVLGTPAPKGSSRAFINKATGRAFVAPGGAKSTEKKIANWNAAVRERALEAIGERAEPVYIGKPISVEIVFGMSRPASHWSKKANGGLLPSAPIAPGTKPDIDKLARTTLDALTGLAFDDDSRIVKLVCTKKYALPGHEGARITISEWT